MAVAHRIRVNGQGKTEVKELTARKAIIEHCKECMGFNSSEVKRCTSKLCPLYPFRTRQTPERNLSDDSMSTFEERESIIPCKGIPEYPKQMELNS